MMISIIVVWILMFVLHIYLLAKWTGEIDMFKLILGLMCPPAALIADIAVLYPGDWVIWRRK